MNLKHIIITYENNEKITKAMSTPFILDDEEENQLINIYPDMEYQEWEGFGGAITDAAGYVYNKMSKENQMKLIDNYFGEKKLNYQMVRIPIDSCDFSTDQYEACSSLSDLLESKFNVDRVKERIHPFLDAAIGCANKNIPIMLTPWSPPAFMKDNEERCHGGKLKKADRKLWADYICNYIKIYQNMGYNINRISIQNEPKAVQTWDSCVYSPQEEKEFLRDYLYPEMIKNGLDNIEIFIWDHNKERAFERACAIIDEETSLMISGIAFHWYSGDHFEALRMIKERFPDKKLILSEACIEYYKYSSENYLENAQKYAHDIIGNMNAGMNGFYDWNLVLDKEGGPNHVGNYCDAPFLYDIDQQHLITRHTVSYISAFSCFIKSGAHRIGVTKYTDKLEVTAFRNPDGSIVLVILNQTFDTVPVNVRINNTIAKIDIMPQSISTSIIDEEFN